MKLRALLSKDHVTAGEVLAALSKEKEDNQ